MNSLVVRIKLYLLLGCISLWSVAFQVSASQHSSLPLDEYFSQTWDTRDGLPHNGINALAQSQDGYLWLGTWEGLARFNGREFKVFPRGSETGLPDSAIKSLTTSGDGHLLVAGARGGVSERLHNNWRPKLPAQALVNHAIYDQDGGLWLGLEEHGLVYRDLENQVDTTVIADLRVYKIVQSLDLSLWVATDKGLFQVKNRTEVTHYGPEQGLPAVPIHTLLMTRQQQLIVGSDLGAFKYQDSRFVILTPELTDQAILSLMQDNNDDIWLGTTNNGVFRLTDNALDQLDDSNGVPDNRILSLLQDNEQSIWIGTTAGLMRLRQAPFITLTTQHGLAGDYVRTVLADDVGHLWVGSSKGLSRIVDDKISSFTSSSPQSELSILSLSQDHNGDMLVGTYTQGIFKVIDDQLIKMDQINKHLLSQEVRSLLVDSQNNLWVGTTAGLVKITPNNHVSYFNQSSGLPANFIMALAEDTQGRIWIGTGAGVASIIDGMLTDYHINDHVTAEYAFGFYSEPEAMWLATDRGILRIDQETKEIVAITRDNGLPIDKFFQIVVDKSDNFWLTSNRGVIRIEAAQITQVLQDPSHQISYQLFAQGVGMLSAQANGGSTPAAIMHPDGTIWIATAKGVSQFSDRRLKIVKQQKLPVVVEQFVVDGVNQSTSDNQSIVLPAGSSSIAVYYAGLGYINPQHIEYQTRLSGFDPDWIDKNNQTYREFTNLAPGQYTFSMRAKYPDDKWSGEVVSISFNIEYFYWQTAPFKVMALLLFGVVIYLGYRYRLIKIERNARHLEKMIALQTTELKKQAQSFAYQATHDQLTNLPNRRAFDNWCDHDFSQAKLFGEELSLAIIDIDHFKRVNDNYSHMTGDLVIKEIADILREQLSDSLISVKLARWGGEEFTMLISANKQHALSLAEDIRLTVENHNFDTLAPGLQISISIGITDNQALDDYDKMIKLADHALYYAKHHGRNQVIVYQEQLHNIDSNERSRDPLLVLY